MSKADWPIEARLEVNEAKLEAEDWKESARDWRVRWRARGATMRKQRIQIRKLEEQIDESNAEVIISEERKRAIDVLNSKVERLEATNKKLSDEPERILRELEALKREARDLRSQVAAHPKANKEAREQALREARSDIEFSRSLLQAVSMRLGMSRVVASNNGQPASEVNLYISDSSGVASDALIEPSALQGKIDAAIVKLQEEAARVPVLVAQCNELESRLAAERRNR